MALHPILQPEFGPQCLYKTMNVANSTAFWRPRWSVTSSRKPFLTPTHSSKVPAWLGSPLLLAHIILCQSWSPVLTTGAKSHLMLVPPLTTPRPLRIHLCIPGILVIWDEVRIQQPIRNSLTYLLCTDSRQHNTKMNTRPGESGYLAPSYFGSQTAYLCYLHHLLMPLEGAHSLCLVSCLPYQHAELWRQLDWTSTAVQLFKNMRIQFGEYNQ